MTPSHRHSTGFTLLELMITVAVLAVLLGLGVPALTQFIRDNRLTAQTNALVGSLNLARAEAAKRGLPVAVCAATNAQPAACAGEDASDWANGWLVFTDRIGDIGSFDVGDELLQVAPAVGQGLTLTTDNIGFARFNSDTSPVTQVAFTVRPEGTSACLQSGQRAIAIAVTGRINTSKAATCG